MGMRRFGKGFAPSIASQRGGLVLCWSAWTAFSIGAIAVALLARRAFGMTWLGTRAPTLVVTNRAYSVATLLLCLALALQVIVACRPKERGLARAAAALGALTAFVGTAGVISRLPGLDSWLQQSSVWNGTEISAIAPNSGVGMALMGLAVALLDWRPTNRFWPAQLCCLLGVALGGESILGHLYNAAVLYHLGNANPMPVDAGLEVFFLSVGILSSRPEQGVVRLLLSSGTGGRIARQLLPTAIIVPITIGYLAYFGAQRHWFAASVGLALPIVVDILGLALLIWWTTARVEEEDHQRRQGEMALAEQFRRAEEAGSQARAVLDATNDAMVLLGSKGSVLTVNRQFGRFFHLSADAILGRDVGRLEQELGWPFGGATQAIRQMASVTPDTEEQAPTLTQEWPERRELELRVAPVQRDDGAYLGRLLTFRDVTSERELNRLRLEFVSSVSHELRTPLTSIAGFLDLFLDDSRTTLSTDQQELLDMVQANVQRLTALINDLLEVSRAESGALELKRAPSDIGAVIRQAAASIAPQLEVRQQRLTLELPDGSPTAFIDADRIGQVLLNLLSNASKYTPPGGSVTVQASGQERWLWVAVRDTGIGISPEDQARLFTRFFRSQDVEARAVGGTGLGLVISRALIELHGGRLEVRSAKGSGSTFSFTLPVS